GPHPGRAAESSGRWSASCNRLPDSRVDLPGVALEDLALLGGVNRGERIDVALGIVEVVPGFRIDAPYRAHHLRPEENVVRRADTDQEIDARLVVDARIEEHVVANQVGERRPHQILRQPARAAPMIW